MFVELSLNCALKNKELVRAWIKEKDDSMISDWNSLRRHG